jgi:DNA-binding winged helix-turn-helix (wHTH) protein
MKRARYRFGEFTLSAERRQLLHGGREVPLIPRYFDLLLLLVEQRERAVSRREIFDAVWADVVVTDNALNQAVRSLRRALHDDPRRPVFIRTVSRHGYQFVCADVREAAGDEVAASATEPRERVAESTDRDAIDVAVARLLEACSRAGGCDEDACRDAAESLHRLGTARALECLDARAGHAAARAWLRETRWDVPGSGDVPILGSPAALDTAWKLVALRLSRALRAALQRSGRAVAGGALAGVVAGVLGALILMFGPGSTATASVLVVLPLVGLAVGGAGAAGVGAGLEAAEAVFRAARSATLVAGGALGGGVVGALGHLVGAALLEGLFGRDLSPVAGGFEGSVIGAAVGLGYALATPRAGGGMATPRGASRLRAVAITGLVCALATASLGASGSLLGAMSLDLMARSFPDSQVGLGPLARLLGEVEPGLRVRLAVSAWEGLAFGTGIALGITYRPE